MILFDELRSQLEGEVLTDKMTKSMYATDASIYREIPAAVVYPKNKSDIQKLILFASTHGLGLIPRAAGTSLAGQCVGNGIVVDISKYMNQILEVNTEESWVRVQPGVIRDDLNVFLKPYHLFFGPNTSTANRATIGGMVGNNSCGSYSIVYGSTRDHTLELTGYLSDGTECVFKGMSVDEFNESCKQEGLLGKIYTQLKETLSDEEVRKEIKKEFPEQKIHRRNTGYAIDIISETQPFDPNGEPINLCKLICGSEGSLFFITEIKIHCNELPPKHTALLCAHFHTLDDSLKATIPVMELAPRAVELMDYNILECTKNHIEFCKYQFFVIDSPQAILVIEVGANSLEELNSKSFDMIAVLQSKTMSYANPEITDSGEMRKVWKLREAGLGLLSNFPGDAKPVAVIEDTAVDLKDLPEYINDFGNMMKAHNQRAVYYAHAGAGEIHLRPVLNLKSSEGVKMLRTIATESAQLVKRYNGSLSGEHGDGRVRAEFIPMMLGNKNYELLKSIKYTWDPKNIFNPGKIIDAPPMDTHLRYQMGKDTKEFDTIISFDDQGGILRAAEKCNGSGDCRKTELSKGTMCPSFMATRRERDTTRARANVLREILSNPTDKNPFNDKDLYEVMDLCFSCKACKSDCPSNVDIALMKAEFLHQYYKSNKVPFRTWAIANITTANKIGSIAPAITNFILTNSFSSGLIKKTLGVAPKRELPKLAKETLKAWFKKNKSSLNRIESPKGKVLFFADEFTNYNDVETGIKAILLLSRLGYQVLIPDHEISGRSFISKGLLTEAKRLANANFSMLSEKVSDSIPLVGIEPSCILSFRDEYPLLVDAKNKERAIALGKNALMIEEFICRELERGNIKSESFTTEVKSIQVHGHCHQKTLSSTDFTIRALSIPVNYFVQEIPSSCCGMAGSFGYEEEHFDVSMKAADLVLFKAIKANPNFVVAAPGTSCRHQIKDGLSKTSYHPAEILYDALKS